MTLTPELRWYLGLVLIVAGLELLGLCWHLWGKGKTPAATGAEEVQGWNSHRA